MSLAGNLRGGAIAEAAADGAVRQAIYELSCGEWPLSGPVHRIGIGQATVNVAIEEQSGKVNPNMSSPAILGALLDSVGVDPAQELVLARALIDWRTIAPMSPAGGLKLEPYQRAHLPYGPPGRPFASVDELGLVLGMSAELLARLRPFVSVYQRGDTPRAAAMAGRGASQIELSRQDKVVRIRATAALANGSLFVRDAVVRLSAQPRARDRAWQVLTWD